MVRVFTTMLSPKDFIHYSKFSHRPSGWYVDYDGPKQKEFEKMCRRLTKEKPTTIHDVIFKIVTNTMFSLHLGKCNDVIKGILRMPLILNVLGVFRMPFETSSSGSWSIENIHDLFHIFLENIENNNMISKDDLFYVFSNFLNDLITIIIEMNQETTLVRETDDVPQELCNCPICHGFFCECGNILWDCNKNSLGINI